MDKSKTGDKSKKASRKTRGKSGADVPHEVSQILKMGLDQEEEGEGEELNGPASRPQLVERPTPDDEELAVTRRPPSAADDVVFIFVESLLPYFVDSWESEPCVRMVFREASPPRTPEEYRGEEEEEESFAPPFSAISSVAPTGRKSRSSVAVAAPPPTPASTTASYTVSGRDSANRKQSRLSRRRSRHSRESPAPNNRKQSPRGKQMLGRSLTMEQMADERAVLTRGSETYGEGDYAIPHHMAWRLFDIKDEMVRVVFVNGNTYEGRVSRRLPEGEGTYTWDDEGVFEGEWKAGRPTGRGLLTWPDLSWYEGELWGGFRHGPGSFLSDALSMAYVGEWKMGKREGRGVFCPSHRVDDFYEGDWQNDQMHGHGLRVYPTGETYLGKWEKGQRHGQGIMVWPNGDIYRGSWAFGEMDGYGCYTSRSYFNDQLCFPRENVYKGTWSRGMRQGVGVFEASSGGAYYGWFDNDLKHGAGIVVCANGMPIKGDPIFIEDRPCKNINKKPKKSKVSSHEPLLKDIDEKDSLQASLREDGRKVPLDEEVPHPQRKYYDSENPDVDVTVNVVDTPKYFRNDDPQSDVDFLDDSRQSQNKSYSNENNSSYENPMGLRDFRESTPHHRPGSQISVPPTEEYLQSTSRVSQNSENSEEFGGTTNHKFSKTSNSLSINRSNSQDSNAHDSTKGNKSSGIPTLSRNSHLSNSKNTPNSPVNESSKNSVASENRNISVTPNVSETSRNSDRSNRNTRESGNQEGSVTSQTSKSPKISTLSRDNNNSMSTNPPKISLESTPQSISRNTRSSGKGFADTTENQRSSNSSNKQKLSHLSENVKFSVSSEYECASNTGEQGFPSLLDDTLAMEAANLTETDHRDYSSLREKVSVLPKDPGASHTAGDVGGGGDSIPKPTKKIAPLYIPFNSPDYLPDITYHVDRWYEEYWERIETEMLAASVAEAALAAAEAARAEAILLANMLDDDMSLGSTTDVSSAVPKTPKKIIKFRLQKPKAVRVSYPHGAKGAHKPEVNKSRLPKPRKVRMSYLHGIKGAYKPEHMKAPPVPSKAPVPSPVGKAKTVGRKSPKSKPHKWKPQKEWSAEPPQSCRNDRDSSLICPRALGANERCFPERRSRSRRRRSDPRDHSHSGTRFSSSRSTSRESAHGKNGESRSHRRRRSRSKGGRRSRSKTRRTSRDTRRSRSSSRSDKDSDMTTTPKMIMVKPRSDLKPIKAQKGVSKKPMLMRLPHGRGFRMPARGNRPGVFICPYHSNCFVKKKCPCASSMSTCRMSPIMEGRRAPQPSAVTHYSASETSIITPATIAADAENRAADAAAKAMRICDEGKKREREKRRKNAERANLERTIRRNAHCMRTIYTQYAQCACDRPPPAPPVLVRLFWWQLMRDCDLPGRNTSLVQLDRNIAENPAMLARSPHDPFERIQFWQFVLSLLEVAWVRYVKPSLQPGAEEAPCGPADGLQRVVRDDLLVNAGNHMGDALFAHRDILPLSAVHGLYKEVGEPHSVRHLVALIQDRADPWQARPSQRTWLPLTPPVLPGFSGAPRPPPHNAAPLFPLRLLDFPRYEAFGRNAVTAGGDLRFLQGPVSLMEQRASEARPPRAPLPPGDEGLSQTTHTPYHPRAGQGDVVDMMAAQLSILNEGGSKELIKIIAKIIPDIEEENDVINIDYELTMLEFLEVLLVLGERAAKAVRAQGIRYSTGSSPLPGPSPRPSKQLDGKGLSSTGSQSPTRSKSHRRGQTRSVHSSQSSSKSRKEGKKGDTDDGKGKKKKTSKDKKAK